ncbi:hypothetical protein H8957_017358, partial [Semnopithecus entellus]
MVERENNWILVVLELDSESRTELGSLGSSVLEKLWEAQPAARSREPKVAQSSRLSRAEWLVVRCSPASGPAATGQGRPAPSRAFPRPTLLPAALPATPLGFTIFPTPPRKGALRPPKTLREPLLPVGPARESLRAGSVYMGKVGVPSRGSAEKPPPPRRPETQRAPERPRVAGQHQGQRPRLHWGQAPGLPSVAGRGTAAPCAAGSRFSPPYPSLRNSDCSRLPCGSLFFRKARVLSLNFKSRGLAQSPPLKSFPPSSGSCGKPRVLDCSSRCQRWQSQSVRCSSPAHSPLSLPLALPPFLSSSLSSSTAPSLSCLLSFLHRESNCAKPWLPRTNPERDPGTGTATPPKLDEAAGPVCARAWRRSAWEGTSGALETPGPSSSSMEPARSCPFSPASPQVLCG